MNSSCQRLKIIVCDNPQALETAVNAFLEEPIIRSVVFIRLNESATIATVSYYPQVQEDESPMVRRDRTAPPQL